MSHHQCNRKEMTKQFTQKANHQTDEDQWPHKWSLVVRMMTSGRQFKPARSSASVGQTQSGGTASFHKTKPSINTQKPDLLYASKENQSRFQKHLFIITQGNRSFVTSLRSCSLVQYLCVFTLY